MKNKYLVTTDLDETLLDSNSRILDESISSEQYAVGFKKGNTKLRDEVEKTLIAMVKDGTFAKISKKWFKADYGILKAN